eukprot:SAG11_NODE_260_length_11531_cov_6.271781_2_plen_109_part_00
MRHRPQVNIVARKRPFSLSCDAKIDACIAASGACITSKGCRTCCCANETLLAAIDDKHNQIYDLSKAVFPDASIEFFGRGEQAFHGPSSGGFVTKTGFTLRERGKPPR